MRVETVERFAGCEHLPSRPVVSTAGWLARWRCKMCDRSAIRTTAAGFLLHSVLVGVRFEILPFS